MKKLLLCLLTLVCLCAPALAEEVIELADAVVTFDPLDCICLTRESSASAFNRVGLSQRDTILQMESYDIYALMWDMSTGAGIQICLYPDESEPLESMSAEEIEAYCEYAAEVYDDEGFFGATAEIYEGESYRFFQLSYLEPYTEGEQHTVYLWTVQQGYTLAVYAFGGADEDENIALARSVADSLRIELPEGVTEIGMQGVTIRLMLPEGMAMQTEPIGAAAPEALTGEVAGVAMAQDGSWYVQWQLVDSVKGDLERLSDAGLRALHEDRARKKTADGCTVTLQEAYKEARQVYVRLGYELPAEDGTVWYAEEYYTKQGGWGVIVTAYSADAPLTEEASAMLRELIAAQLITVKAE